MQGVKYQMGCRNVIGAVLLLYALLGKHAAGFMLPTRDLGLAGGHGGNGRSSSGRSSSKSLVSLPARRSRCTHASSQTFSGPSVARAGGCATEMTRIRTSRGAVSAVGPLSAASGGIGNGSSDNSKSSPVVYAQEALDRAWRSKRRIAAQGKSKPLKQRFMNAFGGRSAVFVDDREFMEETLDNVLRVSSKTGCSPECPVICVGCGS